MNYAALSIFESTIANNTATTDPFPPSTIAEGGGIYNRSTGTVTIHNSTLAGNQATGEQSGYGGGIYNESGGTLSISNSTLSQNSGNNVGGISGTVSLIKNSVVSGNTPTDCLCSGAFNVIGGNAMLGPLQNNGGPTPTMALLPGSPAIDAGDNTDAPEWDQRGVGYPRIVNGTVDIGAFEVQSSLIPSDNGLLAVLITADMEAD
jgi:hypothetical protein